jgi:hypothetical protein
MTRRKWRGGEEEQSKRRKRKSEGKFEEVVTFDESSIPFHLEEKVKKLSDVIVRVLNYCEERVLKKRKME